MPLKLIHGPPNSGRAGLVRRRFAAALDRDPVLVVPTVDDVFSFERELCEGGAVLGGTTMTFGALFRTIATAAGAPPGAELTATQRLRAVELATAQRRRTLGPLRRSSGRPGFARAFARLLDELQGAGLEPGAVEASAATLEGSAYLADIATLFGGYAALRDQLGRIDAHGIARVAIEALDDEGESPWGARPVFLYGFDDLTPNQLALVTALAQRAEVTVALPYEEGSAALAARARLLEALREAGEVVEETRTEADPGNTEDPLLFHLARGFGRADAGRVPPGPGLTLLRSAGERGEAEAIAAAVARLIAEGGDPAEVAIAVRDPARHGPAIATALEDCGIATALEAELPVTATAVGGALVALLEAEFGGGRAADLLRFLRGPSGVREETVDWFERRLRRGRVETAGAALELWGEAPEDVPHDIARLRTAAAGTAAELAETVGKLAATMAARPLRSDVDGPPLAPGDGLELRAASTISGALAELAELGALASPEPKELAATVAGLRFRVWSGPVAGRVRIADPYRLRAARFDHVFVASLQDGEFPRRDRGGDPFLSEAQRRTLGLDPRREDEAEERYLFGSCLALPRRRLFLSYRDSDANGAAEARSPLLDDVRALLDPPPDGAGPDPVEDSITRARDLADVVHPLAEAPSENELARALASHGQGADPAALLAAVGVDAAAPRLVARIEAARAAEAASRAPGPLTNPAVLESLGAVSAYGGTTLELFDGCSYRWFVGHELSPQPLDPAPDPLVAGGIVHAALDRLYRDPPGGEPLPRSDTLPAWNARALELVGEIAAELGSHPAERALRRRVERLLTRFLADEAGRGGAFSPWLLEAGFSESEETGKPALDLGGWGLHGAIDRVDRGPGGGALVLDYKLSGRVTPLEKFEEQAKLQLPLYLLAVAEHWDARPVGGLYHPLRATSARRPRGMVLEEAATELGPYGLYPNDVVGEEEFAATLAEARQRAGAIVARMRAGQIRRDPGPRRGLRGHDVCPPYCDLAPICRRDRAPRDEAVLEGEE
ncbi:MAG TPA: PD-(D/E)XK nuclease family protein [Solirubrobacterales bacterium]|nr:PD-(D/E)XK nuclease family protein [Solirubrobacterales bacterium]